MIRRTFAAIAVALALAASVARAQDDHEYAPIEEREVTIKDWTLPGLEAGAPAVNLRSWAKEKKLVLVVYYAPWCGNWRYESPVVARLAEKYGAKGLGVIAVNNYGTAEEARKWFAEAGGAKFPVVVESEDRAMRDKTDHYALRTACGDERSWGSPFNVFLDPKTLEPSGALLAKRAWVVGGELVEEEAEAFIRERLGLG
jgi:thiol-disulfide isomerase/thioredoxin